MEEALIIEKNNGDGYKEINAVITNNQTGENENTIIKFY